MDRIVAYLNGVFLSLAKPPVFSLRVPLLLRYPDLYCLRVCQDGSIQIVKCDILAIIYLVATPVYHRHFHRVVICICIGCFPKGAIVLVYIHDVHITFFGFCINGKHRRLLRDCHM